MNNENIISLTNDKRETKDKKILTKHVLSDLYLKMLKTDSSLSKESIVWVVKALLRIEEDVTA
jgi:hypothetical protein